MDFETKLEWRANAIWQYTENNIVNASYNIISMFERLRDSFFLSIKTFKYCILAVSATFADNHVTRGLYTYVTASGADW